MVRSSGKTLKKKKMMTSRIPEKVSSSILTRESRSSGFTLIEILIVMSIIGVLAGLVLIAMGSIQKQAKDESTKALVARLNLHIADYYRKKGALPDDGFDTQVEDKATGLLLKGSAALYYQLSNVVKERTFIAGEQRETESEPVAEFEKADLITEDGIVYIIDGHGMPIHYDNLSSRMNLPEDDPAIDPDSVYARWTFTVGFDSNYEIWSLGMREAAVDEDLEREAEEEEEEEEKYDEF